MVDTPATDLPMLDEPSPLEEPPELAQGQQASTNALQGPPQSAPLPGQPSQAAQPGQPGPGGAPQGDRPWSALRVADDLTTIPRAIGAGGLRAAFETKDFLSGGETPQADRSSVRQWADSFSESGPVAGLASGISQFAVGMLGAGKLKAMAEAAPLVGDAVGAASDYLGVAGGASTKAALVGATAFDPHGANLANMVQTVPALQNPVTDYLSAKPGDSEALDRAKNAMLSIGIDAAATALFAAGMKVYKAIRTGEPVAPVHEELAQELDRYNKPPEPANGNDAAVSGTNDNAPNPTSGLPVLSPQEQAEFNLKWAAREADARDAERRARDRQAAVDAMTPKAANDAQDNGRWLTGNDNTPNPSLPAPLPTGAGVEEAASPSLESATPGVDRIRSAIQSIQAKSGFANMSELRAELPDMSREDVDAALRELHKTREAIFSQHDDPAQSAGEAPHRIEIAPGFRYDAVMLDPTVPSPRGGETPPSTPWLGGPPSSVEPTPATLAAPGRVGMSLQYETPTRPTQATEIPSHVPEPGESPRVTTAIQYQIGEQQKAAQGAASSVSVVDSATQGAGGRLPAKPKLLQLGDEQVTSLISSAQADSQALITHGSWENAVDAGHVFGDGTVIPWQKIATEGGAPSSAIDAYIARVASILKDKYDAVKGGDVVGDARNSDMVAQRVALWNEDPAALLGMLQAAGKDATQLRANMDAAFMVGQRVMQDAYALASRINAGYLDEFGGSRSVAIAAFKQVQEVAATAYAQANAMRSNMGRAMRGMRSEFNVSPSDIEALRAADPELMLKLMAGTQGNPKAIITALQPKLWEPGGLAYAARQFGEAAQFLLINNLVSNPLTHAVILAVNGYQVASRPMERIVGSLVQDALHLEAGASGEAARVRAEGLRQYTYMTSTIHDSFQEAVKAFNSGDAIMSPHATELSPAGMGSIGQDIAQLPFKPFDSVSSLLYNVATAGAKAIGVPTRAVGFQDELVKQIVYRSKVLADAHVEGLQNGLAGPELAAHIRDALASSYDGAGRATNMTLLAEAKAATFQQDLVQKGNFGVQTFGSATRDYRNNFPPLKIILPFLATPVNLFRNGVKLTPILNMAQKEYRDMLSGVMGAEQQAQAIGQMATGSLLLGSLATMAYEGRVTGGGPSDPKLRQQLTDAGWQPYSFVLPQGDGSVQYVKFGRFDPVAMPMGMMADIMDVARHPDPVLASKAQDMSAAMLTGMVKALTDKLYLQNIARTLESLADPDKSMWKTAGGIAGSFVPFSSAIKAANPDPYMREARSFIDIVKRGIPGFSETLPPQRDYAGEPVTIHKGIAVTDKASQVDHEASRMSLEQGVTLGKAPPVVDGGADLRTITMQDGSNAYDKYQELTAQPAPGVTRLKDQLGDIINMDAYRKAPDGAANDAGTKLGILTGVIQKYRSAAMKQVAGDPNVSAAMHDRALKTAAAYATQSANPTPANQTSQQLTNLGKQFGVDLHAVTGAIGASPPTPLAPGAQTIK